MTSQVDLQSRLDRLAAEWQVPGAAAALVRGDEAVTAVTGIANRRTGLPVVPETLFAAGSVTKVFTASLVMSLVDEGLVALDQPVRSILPEFRLADQARSERVTVRMLLAHMGGLPGNWMLDLPRTPDVLTAIVARLREMPFNSEPGAWWSYSNAGMAVLGRMAEVLTGTEYDEALAARILRPLGLHAAADPNELILHSVAVGHQVDLATGTAEVSPRFLLDWSNGPAGATLFCDIGALVGFARMHLNGGVGADGTRVLSAGSVAAMQARQAELPWGMGYDGMGLGWVLRSSNGHLVASHTGANAGAHSSLALVPDQQGAVAVLTNGTTGSVLHGMLTAALLEECFGVGPMVPVAAPATPVAVDPARYVGRYVADDGDVTFSVEAGRLRVVSTAAPGLLRSFQLMGFPPPGPDLLTPVDGAGRFVSDRGMPVWFVDDDGAGPRQVYVGRIYRRADS